MHLPYEEPTPDDFESVYDAVSDTERDADDKVDEMGGTASAGIRTKSEA